MSTKIRPLCTIASPLTLRVRIKVTTSYQRVVQVKFKGRGAVLKGHTVVPKR